MSDRDGLDSRNVLLNRTGDRPLYFRGVLLFEGDTSKIHARPDKPNRDVWTVKIYRVLLVEVGEHKAARLAVAIDYRKQHRGKTVEHHFVELTDDVAQALKDYDPLAVLAGYPSGPNYIHAQHDLEANCKRQWDALVTQALQTFPETIQPQTEEIVSYPNPNQDQDHAQTTRAEPNQEESPI